MKCKSILINAGMITQQPSGVGVYSLELLKELIPILQREGYKFTIYCYEPALIENSNVINVRKISLGSFLDKIFKNQETIHRHIWNIIVLNFISTRFDILYSFSSHGTLFHPKQIITIHDLISLSFPKSHKPQYYYFKFFIPFLIRGSKNIVAISNFTKSEVVKHYNLNSEKISVIYNGIDHLEKSGLSEQDEKWIDNITDKMPFCLCVGASYMHKNIETVLLVCERMNSLKVKFIIINKPTSYCNFLKEKADTLNLKNIIFLPYVDNTKLALLYKRARLNTLSVYEGFGFPPAEAAFFETQSILSTQPALIEVYGEGFEYSDPYDTNKIEKIVVKYLFSKRKQRNNSYYQLKKKYNWKATAQKTLDLLDNM